MKGVVPLRSALEWVVAAAVLLGVGWFSADIARSWIARKSEPAVEAIAGVPPGVPTGATSVPLLLLLDGREIRVGQTQLSLGRILTPQMAAGDPHRSEGAHGERITQAYVDRGTRFFITTERTSRAGPFQVTGIYLP